MSPAKRLLLETDWEALSHAYGSAADAPDQLLDLVSEDPAERRSVMTYLWSAIVHQSSLFTATPAVACFLAALLPNEWLDLQTSSMYGDEIYPPTSTRAALLHFLGEVAESATYTKNDDISAAIEAMAPELKEAVFSWVGHSDPDTQTAAVYAGVRVTRLHPQALHEFTLLLSTHAREGGDATGRATSVLGLGQLEVDTTSFQDDPALEVGVFAALTESSGDAEKALATLTQALEMVPGPDWLVARYNVILNSWPKAAMVRALARRAVDFDNVAAAAIAVAATGTDPNLLPPLVELAFPPWAGPLSPPGQQPRQVPAGPGRQRRHVDPQLHHAGTGGTRRKRAADHAKRPAKSLLAASWPGSGDALISTQREGSRRAVAKGGALMINLSIADCRLCTPASTCTARPPAYDHP